MPNDVCNFLIFIRSLYTEIYFLEYDIIAVVNLLPWSSDIDIICLRDETCITLNKRLGRPNSRWFQLLRFRLKQFAFETICNPARMSHIHPLLHKYSHHSAHLNRPARLSSENKFFEKIFLLLHLTVYFYI